MADLIDMCVECGSGQSGRHTPGWPCKWCGGQTTLIPNDKESIARAKADSKRGRNWMK